METQIEGHALVRGYLRTIKQIYIYMLNWLTRFFLSSVFKL